ncbi:hypothetical protein INT47_001934 [Mucor saturninus]|uniref:GDP/GTP exchange factor Sec2 N-terminal domain-containing protein n=1 Tax=Mucor saturninus TaxID=64648 RepID=A0A8H7REN9_9FUNG|nr:hypothetical protein INT47_001934 [Mucor saturninus]
MDPVIFINCYPSDDNLSVPITLKPLPALLAPPTPIHGEGSQSSFFSSASSISNLTAVAHDRNNSLAEETVLKEEYTYNPPNNTAYYTVIQKQSQEIQELRHEIIHLNQKYIDQIDRIQIAEKAQFQVESELEDLSLRLFEQANKMVAEEKKARYVAEKKLMQMERELSTVHQELSDERAQLNELRRRFEEDGEQQNYYHPSDMSNTDTVPPVVLCVSPSPMSMIDSTNVFLDDAWLGLFKDFLTLAPKTSMEAIHRLPFLKQCLELDIEPCLRFGNTTRSRLSIKKVLDAVMREPCLIESDTPKKRHSHDHLSTNTTTATMKQTVRRSSFAFGSFKFRSTTGEEEEHMCYACGTTMHLDLFRFRLKEQDSESYLIDRACRDRLVAVCDFYVFIRHVRSGLQSQRTIQSLFQECIWLKLCMFWARSGVHHYIKDSFTK